MTRINKRTLSVSLTHSLSFCLSHILSVCRTPLCVSRPHRTSFFFLLFYTVRRPLFSRAAHHLCRYENRVFVSLRSGSQSRRKSRARKRLTSSTVYRVHTRDSNRSAPNEMSSIVAQRPRAIHSFRGKRGFFVRANDCLNCQSDCTSTPNTFYRSLATREQRLWIIVPY